ncbi:MAG: DUF2203 domain-containing protein [Thermomicrobia bacterium]|nr:DUF2203 domain-containing protein [Thermomicrobia bacterium]
MAGRPERPHFSRLFTHAEATAFLPMLRPRLQHLAAMKRRLDAVQQEFNALRHHAIANGHAKRAQELEKELHALVHDLNTEIAAIHALGIEVKDLAVGLVDFPSEREDRVVYLCWRMDEPAIVAWHELDGGYPGREPL